MPTPFRILDLDHVVLRTRDPARLERFYMDVLGCPLDLRQEHIGLTQLRAGRALIDIVAIKGSVEPVPTTGGVNMDHFCLRIEPWDPEAISRHLTAHGIPHDDVKSRFGAEGRGPSIYLADPDGNRVELKGPPD